MEIQPRISSASCAAPEITDDLRRNYVQRRLGDLRDVESALKSHNFKILKEVAHKIRGNAASFAYPDLEMLAIRLEEAAGADDFGKAFEVGSEFRKWILSEMCRPWFSGRAARY